MRGRQGGIPLTTPPPKTGPGVKGYLGPVVVFMGICINADRTLRRDANAFGVKFGGKKDPGTKIWRGSKKLSICGIFLLNYDASNSRVIFCMNDSFSFSHFIAITGEACLAPTIICVHLRSSADHTSLGGDFPMIYDMRTYDLNPGALQTYMDAVREVALPLREDYGIKLAGWYYTDIGKLNRVVHIWAYRDYTHFDQARQAVRSDSRWVDEYLPRVKGLVVRQQDQIMLASDFFESRVPALSEDA